MNFLKKYKNSISLIVVGIFIIVFNYVTINHLPYFGKIPAILGIMIIVAGLIKLEFGADGKK